MEIEKTVQSSKIKNLGSLKVALAHDFLLYPGGAEKVLKSLSEIFPEAPIFTLLYDQKGMRGMFKNKNIRTSYLQKLPRILRLRHRWLLPFYPSIPETFDFREYDLVFSSSGAWMKGLVTKLSTVHIAYLHSPMRFVWDYNESYLRQIQGHEKKIRGFFARIFLNYIRLWDHEAAQRPDWLIANSKYTQKRVAKYYRRQSTIIYPPAVSSAESFRDQGGYSKAPVGKDYFLIVSRLSPYKKVDLVVEAFNKLELPLVVIGEGRQEKYLKKIAKSNVKILGWQKKETVEAYYKNARAFIFPTDEDFGITMAEAMSFGLPVIAFRHGGAEEIVREGLSGEFFDAQTVEVLADGVRKFIRSENKYDREMIQRSVENFSSDKFKKEIVNFIKSIPGLCS
jgi:glycosyltransferase involved in cell wall biosynthesis